MKKTSKIILCLSVVTNIFLVSQTAFSQTQSKSPVVPAYSWLSQAANEELQISFTPVASTSDCTAPTNVFFKYTKDSRGKKMHITKKSAAEFSSIKQVSRTPLRKYDFSYSDLLVGKNKTTYTLTGKVLEASNKTITNQGTATWTPQGTSTSCSTSYTIAPEAVATGKKPTA